MSLLGPAMKPSKDMVTDQITFPDFTIRPRYWRQSEFARLSPGLWFHSDPFMFLNRFTELLAKAAKCVKSNSAYDIRSPRLASASPSEARHSTTIHKLPVLTAPART